MNRLNQTEPATFSILLCWALFRDSYFLYFGITGKLKPDGSLFLINQLSWKIISYTKQIVDVTYLPRCDLKPNKMNKVASNQNVNRLYPSLDLPLLASYFH
jgi:hypothetical protein